MPVAIESKSADRHFTLEKFPSAACIVEIPNDFSHPEISLSEYNSTFQNLFGFSIKTADQNVLHFMHPEDQDFATAHVQQVFQSNENIHFNVRIVDKTDRYKWISISGRKLDEKHGIFTFKDSTQETVDNIIKTQLLSTMDDLPELLHRSLDVYHDAIKASTMTLLLPDKTNNEIIEVRYTHKPDRVERYRAITHQRKSKFSKFPLLEQIKNSPQTIIVGDVTELEKNGIWTPHPEGERTWKSLMGVRLADPTTGELQGMILFNHEEKNYFTDQDRFIANLIGDTISVGLKHARDYHGLLRNINVHIEKSNKDLLTGLHNRRYMTDFFNNLEKEEHIRAHQQPTGVLFLDIDDFKSINDTYGHDAGDEVLKSVSRFLIHHFRADEDIVVRYGGEEFVIVGISIPEKILRKKAKKITEDIRNRSIELPGGKVIQITFSLGFAPMTSNDIKDWEKVIKRADDSMYLAKLKGKKQAIEYYPGLEEDLKKLQDRNKKRKKH